MSRKDYELIAGTVAQAWREAAGLRDPDEAGPALRALDNLAHDLAGAFESDNPGFDRARFLTAALPVRPWGRLDPVGYEPCGCLSTRGGAHRVGCPDFPEGVR